MPRRGPDQRDAVRAREAGQVADVHQLGHEQHVDLTRVEAPAQPLRSVREGAHAAGGGSTLDSRQASRAPRDSRRLPFQTTRPTSRSEITEWRRHSSRLPTSDRCTSIAGRPVNLEGVADRIAVMGPGAGVEDQRIAGPGAWCRRSTILAFVVRLEEARLEAELARPMPDAHLQLDQRQRPVVLGVALSEHVEVDAVEDLDAVVAGPSSGRFRSVPWRMLARSPRAISWRRPRRRSTTSPGSRSNTRFGRSPHASCRARRGRAAPPWTGPRMKSAARAAQQPVHGSRARPDRGPPPAPTAAARPAARAPPPRRGGKPRSRSPLRARGRTCGPRFSDGPHAVLALVAATTSSFARMQPSITRVAARVGSAPGAAERSIAGTSPHSGSPAIRPVLITSAKPARSSSSGSVAVRAGVREHRDRLVERADVVLALGQVDAGLAAVGGVDLRDERGRHLHHRHAALVGRRAESRQVPDHAAAEARPACRSAACPRRPARAARARPRRGSCCARPAGRARSRATSTSRRARPRACRRGAHAPSRRPRRSSARRGPRALRRRAARPARPTRGGRRPTSAHSIRTDCGHLRAQQRPQRGPSARESAVGAPAASPPGTIARAADSYSGRRSASRLSKRLAVARERPLRAAGAVPRRIVADLEVHADVAAEGADHGRTLRAHRRRAATTSGSVAARAARAPTSSSTARNASSPSRSKKSAIGSPSRPRSRASASANATAQRGSRSQRAVVVLPAPMKPTTTSFAGRARAAGPPRAPARTCAQRSIRFARGRRRSAAEHVHPSRRRRTSRGRHAPARAPPSPRPRRRPPARCRSRCARATPGPARLVSMSTERSGLVSVGSGFIATRATTGSPVVIPPSMPPARFVSRHVAALVVPEDLVVGARSRRARRASKPSPISTPFIA